MLANVALSVLDEHFAESGIESRDGQASPTASSTRSGELPVVRYADDWVLAVSGTKAHAEALRVEASEVLSTMGCAVAGEDLITHIDEGFDFLGWRIQLTGSGEPATRHATRPGQEGAKRRHGQDKGDLRQNTNQPLDVLLIRLNRFCGLDRLRYGCSSATFNYLRAYTGSGSWMAAPQTPAQHWKQLRHRNTSDGWWPATRDVKLSTRRSEHHAIPLPRNTEGRERKEKRKKGSATGCRAIAHSWPFSGVRSTCGRARASRSGTRPIPSW